MPDYSPSLANVRDYFLSLYRLLIPSFSPSNCNPSLPSFKAYKRGGRVRSVDRSESLIEDKIEGREESIKGFDKAIGV